MGWGREGRVTASGYPVSFWGDDSYGLKEMTLALEQYSSLCIKWISLPYLFFIATTPKVKAQSQKGRALTISLMLPFSFHGKKTQKLLSGLEADSLKELLFSNVLLTPSTTARLATM